jgi:FtsZ-binding cell division protein ZapB
MNELRQQVKKLEEDLNEARDIYETYLDRLKSKVPGALAMKKIKVLELELKHLKNKNKDLTDKLAVKERKMSERSSQIDALKKEKFKLSETYRQALQGKMKIILKMTYKFRCC